MKQSTRLKKYTELFKRNINQFLAPGISIKSIVYPVEADGAVFEFLLNKEGDNTEIIEKTRSTVGKVLSEIPQKMVSGNLEGIRFGGTNLYLENNRILVIKGDDTSKSWTGSTVRDDVIRVVSTSQGSSVS